MKFEDFMFRNNDKPRRWENLNEEERECLNKQLQDQRKEKFLNDIEEDERRKKDATNP